VAPTNKYEDACAPAQFGPGMSEDGYTGVVQVASPLQMCGGNITPAQSPGVIALIERGSPFDGSECSFEQKVLNAQNAGYALAIVYDNQPNQPLIIMDGSGDDIKISAVFISNELGVLMKHLVDQANGTVVMAQVTPDVFVVRSFLFTFVTVVAAISIVFTLFLFCRRHMLVRRSSPRNRMTRRQALKLPKRSFRQTDAEETCCICLEEYKRDDVITELPCGHFFHHKCIKPWLQEQHRVCPICKQDPLGLTEQTPLFRSRQDGHDDDVPLMVASINGNFEDERDAMESDESALSSPISETSDSSRA